jgi:hypothetical protein
MIHTLKFFVGNNASFRSGWIFPLLAGLSSLLLVASCSTMMDRTERLTPKKITEITNIATDFIPQKAVWSGFAKTLYVMEANSSYIHIYKDKKRINTIGGLGFADDNFNKLTDITVSTQGNLLALDSFQKKIKKFDSDGQWLENFTIPNISDPSLLAVTREGSVYIFDRTQSEIVILEHDLKTISYRFGRFQFRNPTQLSHARGQVLVYDSGTDQTLFFDTFGNFDQSKEGFWQTDSYNQQYLLEINRVYHPRSNQSFAATRLPWRSFLIAGNSLILLSAKSAAVYEIKYER